MKLEKSVNVIMVWSVRRHHNDVYKNGLEIRLCRGNLPDLGEKWDFRSPRLGRWWRA